MAKIIIEIEDLPNGGVRYEPHGDLLILDDGTPAQLTWIAVQDVIYMFEKITFYPTLNLVSTHDNSSYLQKIRYLFFF